MSRLVVLIGLAMALAIALPDTAAATNLSEVKKLTASDADADDFFGFSVSASGDTAVAGVPFEDGAELDAGAAYVFQRDLGGVGNWGEVKKLTGSDAQVGDQFGFSVAISGNTVIAGAGLEDAGGDNAGAAYVFNRDEGGADNWGEVKKLTASDAQGSDQFGVSVAVSGDTAVIGAWAEDAGGTAAGAAYVFQRDQGGTDNWGEVKKLTASDAHRKDNFGRSVALSGDNAVVGAPGEGAGAAYVFERDQGGTGNWGEVTKLAASGANFGWSVSVSGDTAVAGVPFEDGAELDAGAAYVFQRDLGGPANWGEVTKLTASDARAFALFGISVAVTGDTAVVGARDENTGGSDAGAAYAFQRDLGGPANWGEVNKLAASDAQADDELGQSVAVAGDVAIVGAVGEDAGGTSAGAAYVFDLLLQKPTPTVTPTFTITPTPTPTPLPPVGGIAVDADARLRPLGTPESSSSSFGALEWAIAGGAVALAFGGGGWYVRRRQLD